MELEDNVVYFSYYNNRKTRNLPLKRVSISISCYEKDIEVEPRLTPPSISFSKYRRNEISFNELILDFKNNKLAFLDPEDIYKKYRGCVLLCHEVEQCHRFAVKEWLESFGYKCIELPR